MAELRARSLADRLNHLFSTVRPRAGQEYTNEQVAAAIGAGGVTISQSYIWQLRKGRKDNPTLKHVRALAEFFGVPAAYFFADEVTDRIQLQLTALKAEQDRTDFADARLMAMRAGELSERGRRQVMELLDVVYRLEQVERGR